MFTGIFSTHGKSQIANCTFKVGYRVFWSRWRDRRKPGQTTAGSRPKKNPYFSLDPLAYEIKNATTSEQRNYETEI
jgi:hypothetical protein